MLFDRTWKYRDKIQTEDDSLSLFLNFFFSNVKQKEILSLMADQYDVADFRQLMNEGSSHFPPAISQHIEILSGYRNLPPSSAQQHHHLQYNLMMFPGSQLSDMTPEFRSDSALEAVTTAGSAASYGGDGGSGRWLRQETLTLLEIRSRLDSKFKEANQKDPLWDEVSRIMSEEYGYERSGKKCREKFENLYKYYKKTREGKSGREDGRKYRFFRQLEALYGETNNGVSVSDNGLRLHRRTKIQTAQANQESPDLFPKHSESFSVSNSSELDTSSTDGVVAENEGWERRKKKIKKLINSQMRKLIEKQEEWVEKLMKNLEKNQTERMIKEEEYRENQVLRIEREHGFWAKERAWIEARDQAFMAALQKLTGGEYFYGKTIA